MFWGLIMEPGRCYTQTVKVSFHVSMAALDISNATNEPAQVMCIFEGRNYLLCTLNNKDKVQCALDLNFEVGSKVSFATNGKSHVHLTGYLTTLDDDEFLEEEEDAEEEKATNSKEKKRNKKEITEGPPKKKLKTAKNSVTSEEEAEEEEDDSDFDLDNPMNEEDEDENEEEVEEEASSLSEDDEEVEEEEEEEEDDEEEQVEKSQPKSKPKQNGVQKLVNSTPKQKEEQKSSLKANKKQDQSQKKENNQKKTVLKGGVIVQELKEGTGAVVKQGKFVQVYYEGRLKENNKMFDSTTKGPGFSFRLGKGEVIKGWDIGIVGMKVGGKRRIICPPQVAYGAKGSPPVIPPNATLVFDVELKKIS